MAGTESPGPVWECQKFTPDCGLNCDGLSGSRNFPDEIFGLSGYCVSNTIIQLPNCNVPVCTFLELIPSDDVVPDGPSSQIIPTSGATIRLEKTDDGFFVLLGEYIDDTTKLHAGPRYLTAAWQSLLKKLSKLRKLLTSLAHRCPARMEDHSVGHSFHILNTSPR